MKFKQYLDKSLMEFKEAILGKHNETLSLGGNGSLRCQGRLCVPNVDGLCDRILEEAHGSRCSIHLGLKIFFHDLKDIYWWEGLKRDIAEFVAKCPNRK